MKEFMGQPTKEGKAGKSTVSNKSAATILAELEYTPAMEKTRKKAMRTVTLRALKATQEEVIATGQTAELHFGASKDNTIFTCHASRTSRNPSTGETNTVYGSFSKRERAKIDMAEGFEDQLESARPKIEKSVKKFEKEAAKDAK